MHAQDRRMRRSGLPGNVCCAVMHLDQGFDAGRLRRRLGESPIMDWLARARMARTLPVLAPVWRTAAEPKPIFFEHHDQNGGSETPWSPPPVVAERALRAEDGPGLAFDVVRHADGTSHLFLSWNHTLLDSQGLDLLLHHLNAGSAANGAPSVGDFISPKQQNSKWTPAGWWENAKLAHSASAIAGIGINVAHRRFPPEPLLSGGFDTRLACHRPPARQPGRRVSGSRAS